MSWACPRWRILLLYRKKHRSWIYTTFTPDCIASTPPGLQLPIPFSTRPFRPTPTCKAIRYNLMIRMDECCKVPMQSNPKTRQGLYQGTCLAKHSEADPNSQYWFVTHPEQGFALLRLSKDSLTIFLSKQKSGHAMWGQKTERPQETIMKFNGFTSSVTDIKSFEHTGNRQ